MAASAGTVTLSLDADSVKLIRELQKSQKQTTRTATRMRSDMTKSFKAMGKQAALFGVAMAAASVAVAKHSISMADNIGKSADALGLGIEEFQEYEFAAGRAGVATTQFTSNMTAFVKRVGEAKAGMGPLVSGLKNLNPVLLENLKNSTNQGDALRLVAEAIKNTKSATERAAIANAAFSRAGISMVNMLDDGAAGLNKVSQEARDLGIVMREDLVRKAEEATDKMGDLQKVLQIRVAETVLENADAIITLTTSLINFVGVVGKSASGWRTFIKEMGEDKDLFLGKTSKNIRQAQDDVRELEVLIRQAHEFEKKGLPQGPRLKSLMGDLAEARAELARLKDEVAGLEEIVVTAQHIEFTPTFDLTGVQGEVDKVAEIINKMMDEVATFGMSGDEKALFKLIDEGATEDQIALIRQVQDELRLLKEAEEIANAELEEIVVTARKISPAITESADEMTEFGIQAARNLQTAFADFLFDPFDEGVKGMVEGFAKALQRMMADALAASILNSFFTALAGSSNAGVASFGSAMIGRASGGPVSAGTAYLVGEKGPELLTMGSTSGHIIPNDQLGGGQSVTVNIDARETDDPGRLLALVPVIQTQIEQSIALKTRRGYL